MTIRPLSGVNYSLDGDTVQFFGAKGCKFSADRWGINAFGAHTFVEVDPDSITPEIRALLKADVEAGDGDKVAQIQLGPRQAVVFFLEGAITRDQLAKAAEGVGFIDIPDVTIDGRTLTVRVLAETLYEVATADSTGTVL